MAKGRGKQIYYENGRYCGTMLEKSTCSKLEALLKLNKENGYVEDLRHIIYELPTEDIEYIKQAKSSEFVDLDSKRGRLENLQTLGVAYMYFAERLVLGDNVGMGKTIEVCGLCNLIESTLAKQGLDFRFLLLTEKNLVTQTTDKMIKFTGNYVESLYGEKAKVQKFVKNNKEGLPPNIVGSHSLINSVDFQEYIRYFMSEEGYNPFDILIIDEAGSILTNTTTNIYKNAQFFERVFDRVIILNGTAFEKDLRSFYNQINFIDNTLLPTKTAFSNEYEEMVYGIKPYPVFMGKYKNQEKFRDLVSYRYFARTRKEWGAKMENCTAEVLVSQLSPEQKKLINLVSIPTMVYDCPSYFSMQGIETNTDTTPKLRDLVDLVTERLVNQPSILVYARYKEAQYCIQKELQSWQVPCEVMNGDTPQSERDELINKFKLGDLRVLVTNVQKGLDFGDCKVCIFYDYDPNPNKMVQFEGRMTRSFDIIDKHVYLLISKGKELNTFKNMVADRAQASDIFAGSDFSCVLSILLEDDKLKSLK